MSIILGYDMISYVDIDFIGHQGFQVMASACYRLGRGAAGSDRDRRCTTTAAGALRVIV